MSNPNIQPLSVQVKNWLNRTPAVTIASWVNEGKFTLEQLADYASERPAFADKYSEVCNLIAQLPNAAEIADYENVKLAFSQNPWDDNTNREVCRFLRDWESTPSARAHLDEIKEYERRISEHNSFAQISRTATAMLEAYRSFGQLPTGEVNNAIRNFISMWSGYEFAGTDVEHCKAWMAEISSALSEATDKCWAQLLDADGKLADFDGAARFLKEYPVSDEMRAKVDDAMWNWAMDRKDIEEGVRCYQKALGSSARHTGDIVALEEAANDWARYEHADIFQLITFIRNNPEHPYLKAAKARVAELKQETLDEIRRAPSKFDYNNFISLYNSGIFEREELMEAAGADDKLFDRILDIPRIKATLPEPPNEYSHFGSGMGQNGVTDIVFFGITSSGKTCVLSGLLINDNLWFDPNNFSGDYGDLVRQYSEQGVALSGTPVNFVGTVYAEGKFPGEALKYKFNLFEMAGEAFRSNIADARYDDGDKITDFSDMGDGAPEILNSTNDKVFFILIDPTNEYVQLQEQTKAIRALTNLFFTEVNGVNPNAEVMRRVKGLHFIVTKSDTLPEDRRMEHAREHVHRVINSTSRDILVENCRKYGINASKTADLNGRPRIFPYSLGQFTVGNIFRYNPKGSEDILRVICDYCSPERYAGFGYKIRSAFKTPLI